MYWERLNLIYYSENSGKKKKKKIGFLHYVHILEEVVEFEIRTRQMVLQSDM